MKADATTYSDILNSKNGLHISIYLPRPTSDLSFKNLLEVALLKCQRQLNLTNEDLRIVLGPIFSLADNPKMISAFNSNVAIFKNQHFLRIISLPLSFEFSVHVADSFHVKPLLEHLNKDYQYLHIGCSSKKVYLFKGRRNSYELIDDYFLQDERPKQKLKHVAEKVALIDSKKEHTIFISAGAKESHWLRRILKNHNVYWRNVSGKFHLDHEKEHHEIIQKTLDIEKSLSLSLTTAELENPTPDPSHQTRISYDLHEIAREAYFGRVQKLFIASDVSIFGSINEDEGTLTIHEQDSHHKDDDLLDDIAQKVFQTGGDVLVTSREQMPQKKIIAATIVKSKKLMSAS